MRGRMFVLFRTSRSLHALEANRVLPRGRFGVPTRRLARHFFICLSAVMLRYVLSVTFTPECYVLFCFVVC